MIKETDIKQITENIQYKFNTLLEESLNKIEKNLKPTLFIYNKKNQQSIPRKTNNIKKIQQSISNTNILKIGDNELHFEEVSSDIG